ncbi:glycosyltransferase family 4 protein [Flavobacterium sp. CYK-4]|uniref:glycosyltransferase n=1 Tax=Flavobacterium lotistagni TaxID=2709660 RepID=UPI00140A75B4|nr:glycosyltransferase [Flavobacterium lotistagni]NHM06434.1 glycosyltransferase family 4 protein [Flavobacterium lotistagni]
MNLEKNKDLCFVIHSLQAGGMERVMSELLNYFAAKNEYRVHLVLYGIKRDVFYTIPENIKIYRPDFVFDNSKRLLSTIKTHFFLRKTIKQINPISVLSFGERWNSMVLLAMYGTKIPVYVSDRAQPDKSLGKLHDKLRIFLYPKAKGIIAQTQKAEAIFRKMYGHENFKVIGNPIRPIENTGETRENVILMVGRYIQSKQQNVLIEIFAKLNAPDWKLVLVGYDHLKQKNQHQWEALAQRLNVEERVVFAGKQENVEHYYNTSKIFAFSSASEGFPNVVGEAMSAGLPVVSFDCVAGPSDLITDNENGFLIPLNNQERFAEKLQFLIDHPQQRESMGKKAKEAMAQFELNYICSAFEQFIVSNQ